MTPDELAQAACRGKPTSIFYPDGVADALYDQARRICSTCPVIESCRRDHAKERMGMWHGTTPAERGYPRQAEQMVLLRKPSDAQRVRSTVCSVGGRQFSHNDITTWVDGTASSATITAVLGRIVAIGRGRGNTVVYRLAQHAQQVAS